MLDLFCGRGGWTNAFLDAGWEVIGVDLEHHACYSGRFVCADVLDLTVDFIREMGADFICASSPCEQFSVHGMRHFHPNPKYPELGIRLFNHTRAICEAGGLPYVMENVRPARMFVGSSVGHAGPFYLWGNAVPPILPRGLIKGMTREAMGFREFKGSPMWNRHHSLISSGSKSHKRKEMTALNATIPPLLAKYVQEHADWLLREGPRAWQAKQSAEQIPFPL